MMNSLSGRFLILTTILVMLAEVLIFVPSIARFREEYLQNRLERAQIASLALLADDMIDSELEEPYKAVDIDMTVTFHSDGTFQPEGGYTLQSATGVSTIRRHLWGEYKWKIEGDKLYFSDDSFLDYQISFSPWTGVIRSNGEEFPVDGLNILGITDTKITLEILVNNTFTWAEIPRQFKRVGTIVLEK